MRKKVLVSGFEPYGGITVNPTQALVEEAGGFGLERVEVHTVLLPVNYDECAEKIVAEIERVQPDAVVSCGLFPGRTAVTPERIGINVKDTMAEDPIADNRGRKPLDEPINPNGPEALFATLPYRKMVDNLLATGVPSFVSNTAGTYICNNTLYATLDYVRRNGLPTIAGFVHFPASTEMAVEEPVQPSLPVEIMIGALRSILETVVAESSVPTGDKRATS